jgi:aryl-alcohol dehydrogenase-like predicted oxidoreductase
MRYKLFGHSGLRVSELSLGTLTFGSDQDWCACREESKAIFDKFANAGGNFIDTANLYTEGESEELVGEFVRADREFFVVASKYAMHRSPNRNPNMAGNQRKNLTHSLEASLRRLQLDYIDVYWLHIWDYTTPVEEVMRALDDAVRAGKILYIGISDAPAWVTARGNALAELQGWTSFIGLQNQYSLVERTIEREHLPMAKELDLSLCAWGALGTGFLTGKYTRNSGSKDGRLLVMGGAPEDEFKLTIAREVDTIADEIGCSSSHVALNWIQQQGHFPIVGARTAEQLSESLKCLNHSLSDEQMSRLDSVSTVDKGHPYATIDHPYVRDIAYGGMADEIETRR